MKAVKVWGEEGKKLFTFQRSVYLNSSLAQDAVRKRLRLIFPEKTAATPLLNAAAVDSKKNSK